MEYTKDIVLNVNYGQASTKNKHRWNIFENVSQIVRKHKVMTSIISITLMLMILDFMLISSFVSVLSEI